MLQEPFCLDYIKNFNDEIKKSDFSVESETWIDNHVQTWWCIGKSRFFLTPS